MLMESAFDSSVVAMKGKPSLSAVSGNPEAQNLLAAMLQPEAKQRPSMEAVMAHPFWWRHGRRLAFLLQVSDRVELEDREVTTLSLLVSACVCLMHASVPLEREQKLVGQCHRKQQVLFWRLQLAQFSSFSC